MYDVKIKVTVNGWIVEDRYGIQFVHEDSKEFLERVMRLTLTMAQKNKLTVREVIE